MLFSIQERGMEQDNDCQPASQPGSWGTSRGGKVEAKGLA